MMVFGGEGTGASGSSVSGSVGGGGTITVEGAKLVFSLFSRAWFLENDCSREIS